MLFKGDVSSIKKVLSVKCLKQSFHGESIDLFLYKSNGLKLNKDFPLDSLFENKEIYEMADNVIWEKCQPNIIKDSVRFLWSIIDFKDEVKLMDTLYSELNNPDNFYSVILYDDYRIFRVIVYCPKTKYFFYLSTNVE